MLPAFADNIDVIQDYEPVHLLTSSQTEKTEAMRFLAGRAVTNANITWHVTPLDNAWLRDNEPIYATDGVNIWIQNWKFDAWGGNFGRDVGYENDDLVPLYVGQYLGMTVEDQRSRTK